MIIGGNEYSEIIVTDKSGNLLVSITDKDIITSCRVECVNAYRTYAVTAINMENKHVVCDLFTATCEAEARKDFKECYRHAVYKILSIAPLPDDEKGA